MRDIIRASRSPYSARVLLVPKKNNKLRMCVDLRPLNDRVHIQKYPFPNIEDHLSNLHGKSVFTTLDLRDGFYQISVAEEDRKFLAFSTPEGHYEFNRLPFGYANSPAEFQGDIFFVFAKMINEKKILVYLDDLMIATNSCEENLNILRETLITLKKF